MAMSNNYFLADKYAIPHTEYDLIISRDKTCVYCRKKMLSPYNRKNHKDSATIEHLNHRQDWDSVASYVAEGKTLSKIITICCGECNSSRSKWSLKDWFGKEYCIKKGISYDSVSETVREYFDIYES